MLKIIYNAEPFYSNYSELNEPVNTELTITINEDASNVEIVAQIIKLLEFMGYSKQTKKGWLELVNLLTSNGYLIDDMKDKLRV